MRTAVVGLICAVTSASASVASPPTWVNFSDPTARLDIRHYESANWASTAVAAVRAPNGAADDDLALAAAHARLAEYLGRATPDDGDAAVPGASVVVLREADHNRSSSGSSTATAGTPGMVLSYFLPAVLQAGSAGGADGAAPPPAPDAASDTCCLYMPAPAVARGGVGHISACRGGAATCADVTDPPAIMFTPDSR